METSIESLISFLEETNDPSTAYFSFTVDDTGEYGVIKANQQGLCLYAAEMLKKSVQLQHNNGEPIFFEKKEWIVSDAGYDLIQGVVPHQRTPVAYTKQPGVNMQHSFKNEAGEIINASKGCFFSFVMIATACAAFLFAAFKWFR